MVCICVLLHTSSSYAQVRETVKTEREYRIKSELVPQTAKEFIATFNKNRSVKWLREENDDGASIEAKFRYRGRRHSVEFTTDGTLDDVEIIITKKDLPAISRQNIERYFAEQFNYFKIEKIQAQYDDHKKAFLLRNALKITESSLIPRYEIVVKTRISGKKSKRYEVLFNDKGTFISRSQVSVRRDNILRF
jgi:hypothetical protein